MRPMVKMMQPRTVKQAVDSARLQEMTIEAMLKKQRSQMRGLSAGGWQPRNRAMGRDIGQGSKNVLALPPTTTLAANGGRMMEQRHLVGLCYRCGDKYFVGHKCKRQLLLLE